jgi:hypothetical protein
MTLDASGNLGVGTTSPSGTGKSVEISGSGDATVKVTGGTGGNAYLQLNAGSSSNAYINSVGSGALIFGANGVASSHARITSEGNFLVNITTSVSFGSGHRIYRNVSEGGYILSIDGGVEYAMLALAVSSGGYSGNLAAQWIGKNSTTSRSINAGGTINASGADYAEYMEKAGDFIIAKGDICGIDINGKLTNVYADAISFVVKSTNPSYVGNDTWGVGFKDDVEGLENARQNVDRIAFAGQVPVNVLGATPGQYIIPVNDNGNIKGMPVSNPTFEQYQSAVGKVISIQEDGRASIIVKTI